LTITALSNMMRNIGKYISSLSRHVRQYNLILNKRVPSPFISNRFGGTTRVKRYWFSESDIAKIRKILGKEL